MSSLWLLCLILLTACTGSTVYFTAESVDHDSWLTSDSLLFPIHVVETSNAQYPVQWGNDYNISLVGRHSYDYPYQEIPVLVSFQQLDSLGWNNWGKPFKLSIPTADQEGHLDGGGWGSIYTQEVLVTGRKLNFPRPGEYRIIVHPDTTLYGVLSIAVELD